MLNAPPEHVYNVPVTLGAGVSRRASRDRPRAKSTWKSRGGRPDTVRLEGGNDLVYQPLIRARLGMLDLDWFKREVRYCLMPERRRQRPRTADRRPLRR